MIKAIIEFIRESIRLSRIKNELRHANIRRIPAPMLGTQIRRTNPAAEEADYSPMFLRW